MLNNIEQQRRRYQVGRVGIYPPSFLRSEAKNPLKLQNSFNLYVSTVDVVKNWTLALPVFTKLRRPWKIIKNAEHCWKVLTLAAKNFWDKSSSKRSHELNPVAKKFGGIELALLFDLFAIHLLGCRLFFFRVLIWISELCVHIFTLKWTFQKLVF